MAAIWSVLVNAAIAKQLTEEGVKNRFGEIKWYPSGIAKILRNEKYCGDLRLQKYYVADYISKKSVVNQGERPSYYVRDSHDPIVTKEQFHAVQEEISRRAENAHTNKEPTFTVFTGLITCGRCGKHFARCSANAGTKYSKPAWVCKTSNRFGKEYCDMGQRIPESILKQITCDLLGMTDLTEEAVQKSIQEILVPAQNTLIFRFTDGSEKQVEWHNPSRSFSWTPEMKEMARQRALARHKAEKERGD